MRLDWPDIQSRKTGVPRVSGDEPQVRLRRAFVCDFSLRERV